MPGRELSIRYEHLRKMIGRPSRERELFVQQGLVVWMRSWANTQRRLLHPPLSPVPKRNLTASACYRLANIWEWLMYYLEWLWEHTKAADHPGRNAFLYIR